jgi:hypothetical protein
MIPLFLGLTCANLLALTLALILGYFVKSDPTSWGTYHQLAGVLAAMTCMAVHCIVFTYFVATAKWAQHAVSVKQLDPALTAPTRSFKAQAFPAALLAMTVVFVTAVAGAATFSGYFRSPLVHHVLAWVSVGVNVVVAWIEYRAVARNGALIDTILAQITPTAAVGAESV